MIDLCYSRFKARYKENIQELDGVKELPCLIGRNGEGWSRSLQIPATMETGHASLRAANIGQIITPLAQVPATNTSPP